MATEPITDSRAFIFSTGIENSYPVITGRDGKDLRRDSMALSDHYRQWKHDFSLVQELGIRYLRFGPPYYRCHRGPGQFDWEWGEEQLNFLHSHNIILIADLCHFGVPDWVGNFQNPDWPKLFAEYAGAFARKFPFIHLFTPVNEVFICSQFSAKFGFWNERLKSDQAFVTALTHLAKATLLAEDAILKVTPNATFIQSESSTYYHPASPDAMDRANFENERRFLSLDLCYGHEVHAEIYEYLLDNGMPRDTYHWFMHVGKEGRRHCVMGSDYYVTNEKKVMNPEGVMESTGEVLGYYQISKDYFTRYRIPLMHTETNLKDADRAPTWLWKEWFNIVRIKGDGIPLLGFTWYSLLDQTDWDVDLREENHRVNPCGLYDLSRKIHPVGREYKELIARWNRQLPMESVCRDLGESDGHHHATGG